MKRERWWIMLLAIVIALILFMSFGCRSAEPETIVITRPEVVEVLVYVPPEKIVVPEKPAAEVCQDRASMWQCAARNTKRLQIWANAAWEEIKRHNQAVEDMEN